MRLHDKSGQKVFTADKTDQRICSVQLINGMRIEMVSVYVGQKNHPDLFQIRLEPSKWDSAVKQIMPVQQNRIAFSVA